MAISETPINLEIEDAHISGVFLGKAFRLLDTIEGGKRPQLSSNNELMDL